MGFLESFFDYVSVLFSSDPGAAKKRRELRAVYGILKDSRPALYKTGSQKVLPAFATAVFDLSVALRPVKDLLEHTVLIPDSKVSRRFWDFLIERYLGEGIGRLLESCSYDSLKGRMAASPKREEVLQAGEADFKMILNELNGPALKVADADLAHLERLADLCRYDFGRVLKTFDPSARPESTQYKPHFMVADGIDAVPHLMDLYTVTADFYIDPSTVDALKALSQRLGEGDQFSAKYTKPITQINKILGSTLSVPLMTALIRALREDPAYQPMAPEVPRSFTVEYRGRLIRRWTEDRDRIQREFREQSLETDISVLFGEGLLSVMGYDAALNERLKREQNRSFAWMLPLSLCKTFESRYVSGAFLESVRRLVVEGFFQNAVLRSRLTDSIGYLEKMGSRIAAFEEISASNPRSGAAALRVALDESVKGKDRTDAVEKIVRTLDDRAKELVSNDVKVLRILAESIFDVMSDFRKPTPELVSNIKTLAVSKDKALIPNLVNGYNGTAKFLKIMQAYLVVSALHEGPAT
jgi:hypothetical protein